MLVSAEDFLLFLDLYPFKFDVWFTDFLVDKKCIEDVMSIVKIKV